MAHAESKRSLDYVIAAAAVTLAAAALCVAAARVRWLGDFLGAGGAPDGAGLWLKYALCFAAPAVLWAVALSRLVPRVALRIAGLVAQSWFVYFVVALSVIAVAYVGVALLSDRPLTPGESTPVFQSKIFCRGRLAAPAPATEADLAHAFFRSRDEVVRFGRWFSLEPPLHPALLCLGRLLGWPKLIPAVAAAVTLFAVYFVGRRVLGFFGGAVTVALAATSPAFIYTQASYLPGATFICFFALAIWACLAVGENPSGKAALALGTAAGAAFLVCEYDALYLAVPFGWYLWRRTRGRGVDWPRWFAAGVAPFVAAWALYNWRQTGNVFLPPRFFSDVAFFGFGGGYTLWDALSSSGRNLVVLSADAFGWPLLCLVPAIWRLFWKPRPDDFEKALYGAILLTILARLPLREAGAAYGAVSYYASWFCLVFITARFFVILAAKGQKGFKKAGEGLAAFVLAALIAVNLGAYSPRAASHYGRGPGIAAPSWTDPVPRRRIKASILDKAVVIIKPRDVCLSSMPGSPFLDDRVVFARDNGEKNAELAKIFPGRDFYLLDYGEFGRTGEIVSLDF